MQLSRSKFRDLTIVKNKLLKHSDMPASDHTYCMHNYTLYTHLYNHTSHKLSSFRIKSPKDYQNTDGVRYVYANYERACVCMYAYIPIHSDIFAIYVQIRIRAGFLSYKGQKGGETEILCLYIPRKGSCNWCFEISKQGNAMCSCSN